MLNKAKMQIQRSINRRLYNFFAAGVGRPEFKPQQLSKEGYVSQFGQDKWVIEKLFSKKQNGTFVDIGANDGITFSNTYVLETMGWGGVAIEPIPSVYKKLVNNRRCVTVNGCIAPMAGKSQFRAVSGYSEMLSGLVQEYDPRHLKRIDDEIQSHGGGYEDIEVECYNLNDLLENNGINQVDYLSIDIEGAELNILNSIDFNRINIAVIGVENNYKDYRMPRFFAKNDFKFHSIVGDEFYINKRHYER